ncbi:unnamed protein product [Coregonus sp. 'balchen']|nr:unnamed protein product [Coregonus sp. 'balchen']
MDIPGTDLRRMVFRAYGVNFASKTVAPVKHHIHNQFVQEFFHGPTASFKDLAFYCLPQMCNYLILVAASGDTDSAVLSGFGSLNDLDRQRVGLLVFFSEE